jgi:hypothetical protein
MKGNGLHMLVEIIKYFTELLKNYSNNFRQCNCYQLFLCEDRHPHKNTEYFSASQESIFISVTQYHFGYNLRILKYKLLQILKK